MVQAQLAPTPAPTFAPTPAPMPDLFWTHGNPDPPMVVCQGDCDTDSDCPGISRCIQRTSGAPSTVEGCAVGDSQTLDRLDTDYCNNPPDCPSLIPNDKWGQNGWCSSRCTGSGRCSKKCAQRCSPDCSCNQADTVCKARGKGGKWVTKCPRLCHGHGHCHWKCESECTSECSCNSRRLLATNVTDVFV